MVAVKVAVSESVRRQTPTYDIPATARKQAIEGMLASQGSQKQQPQHELQDLCGKTIKVAGNEARNTV